MASAVDYLVLTVVHRTNEDWALDLPLAIPAEELAGAVAVCQLVAPGGATLVIPCSVEDQTIVQRAESEAFAGFSGQFSGDVLLTLVGGRDLVTHLINLDLKRGVSRNG